MAVFAPIPIASVASVTQVNRGDRISRRTKYRSPMKVNTQARSESKQFLQILHLSQEPGGGPTKNGCGGTRTFRSKHSQRLSASVLLARRAASIHFDGSVGVRVNVRACREPGGMRLCCP